MLYWVLKSLALGPVIKVVFRPWVEGMNNVPREGAAILASNHLSFSDSIFLPAMLSRRITFPAKMEYFTGTGVKGRLVAAFFRGVGQIPIDRSGGKASAGALDSALEILRDGGLFGIYPEGTRSPDGRLYRGKTGVARLALQAGCPVVPVAMIGTDKAQPTGQIVPNIMRIGIRIGAPLDFSRYADRADDREVLRAITDEIMAAIEALSGQEYVDEYAADRKKSLLAAAKGQADSALAQARVVTDAATAQAKVATDAAVARARLATDAAAAQARQVTDAAVGQARVATDAVVTRAVTRAKEIGEQTTARIRRDDTTTPAHPDVAAADTAEPAPGSDAGPGPSTPAG